MIERARPAGTWTRHFAIDAGTGRAPKRDGFRIAPDLKADLLEQLIGVLLYGLERVLREQLVAAGFARVRYAGAGGGAARAL